LTSLYGYRPSIAANTIFLAVAGLCILGYAITCITTRRWITFTIVLSIGCILDIIGFAERIQGWNNPWDVASFINGIICLTIAPVFITAG
jgi:RTA1 like protein